MHFAYPTDNIWLVAGVWMSLAALSGFIAIRIKMPAALVEIIVGMLAGNIIALRTNAWIDFIAGFGSILLTFLAGAEIDPAVLRKQLLPSSVLGAASFGAPFVAAMAYAYFIGHWTPDASKIAGIAMSTTSVAVVYAVMIESGLAGKEFGQLILAACFFTDLGTVVALGLLFANYNFWLAGLAGAIAVAVVLIPKLLPSAIVRTQRYVSEPALRILFARDLSARSTGNVCEKRGSASRLLSRPRLRRHDDRDAGYQAAIADDDHDVAGAILFFEGRNVHRVRSRALEIGLIAALFVVKVGAKIVGRASRSRACSFVTARQMPTT